MSSLRERPRLLRLRTHLSMLVAGAVLPALAFTAGLLFWLVRQDHAAVERRLLQNARAQAQLLDRDLVDAIHSLQGLAEDDHLDRGDLPGFHAQARRVLATQPTWFEILLISPAGEILLDTSEPFGPLEQSAVEPESLRRLVETGRPTIGTLRRGRAATFAFPVRVPVLRGGALRYVLTAVIKPEALAGLVRADAAGSGEWTRTIVDSAGTVVARTRAAEEFVGRPGTPSFLRRLRAASEGVYIERTLDGVDAYMALSRAEASGWACGIAVPRSVVDAPFRRSLRALGAVGLLLLLLGLLGAYLTARRVSADIAGAARAAAALAHGEPAPPGPSFITEVQALRQSLDGSARLLAARARERDEHLRLAEAARAEAEAASRSKDEFLAMLGHELRNPLSPIVTALQLLRLRGVTWGRELAIIERQTEHMIRLVEDLLDVSRITRGTIEIGRDVVAVPAVLARAVEMTAPLFEERRHRLEVDEGGPDLHVRGDELRLSQVIGNLLVNAARYTPPGGHVRVRAELQGDEVAIEVSDDGKGIAPELLPRLFDLFVQGPQQSDRREGGLGLGLSIVRSLVALHGGRVEARSEGPGRGSAFTVRLPAVAGPARPASTPQRALALPAAERKAAAGPGSERADRLTGPAARRLRVLVVDDNEDAAELLAQLLGAAGHEIRVAADGPTALALAEEDPADVALLDIGLPVMDGYELGARLRERLGPRAPVLIAVTGYGQARDRERSRAAGFALHLVKPVDASALIELLGELLGGLSAHRAASPGQAS